MSDDQIVIAVICAVGMVDVLLEKFTGKSLLEWLIPERRRG